MLRLPCVARLNALSTRVSRDRDGYFEVRAELDVRLRTVDEELPEANIKPENGDREDASNHKAGARLTGIESDHRPAIHADAIAAVLWA
jgi:hypothetical protein